MHNLQLVEGGHYLVEQELVTFYFGKYLCNVNI